MRQLVNMISVFKPAPSLVSLARLSRYQYLSALAETATAPQPQPEATPPTPEWKPRPPPLRLPPMPTVRDMIKLYKLSAIKHLSQNFLLDEKVINKIVKKGAGSVAGCYVCEVGPGPGSITRSIINKGAKKLILIEKDKRFKHSLQILNEASPGRDLIEIIWADVLAIDLSQSFPPELKKEWDDNHAPKIHLIGNLPFSISTPLIIRWLKAISTHSNAWAYGRVPLTLTFQQEVAERLAAEENHDQRCRLSIMAQYLCEVYHKFKISGNAFVPKPDVDVGVVKFIPRKQPLINQPFELVEKVVRQVFSMRQKYCRRGASTLFPESIRDEFTTILFEEAEINPETRPFELTMEQFQRLCDTYAAICKSHPSIYEYNYRGRKPDETWEELHGAEFADVDVDAQDEEDVTKSSELNEK